MDMPMVHTSECRMCQAKDQRIVALSREMQNNSALLKALIREHDVLTTALAKGALLAGSAAESDLLPLVSARLQVDSLLSERAIAGASE